MREEKNCSRRSSTENGNGRISRSKALGVIALMLGLFIFQVTVFIVERIERASSYKESREEIRGEESKKGSLVTENNLGNVVTKERFEFDPNTISIDSLCRLGLTEKQAGSIIKYRDKGGRFRKREDFAKMYVIDSCLYEELSGYIVIKERGKRTEKMGKTGRIEKVESIEKHTFIKDSVGDTAVHEKKPEYGRRFVVELNSADSAELVKLYGIGGYYAKKILLYRARIGGFYAPEQLMEIEGIDSARFARFSKNIEVDAAAIKRFSFDTAGKAFLVKHPYIGAYAARGIVLLREKFGAAACTLENLVKERILTKKAAENLWYYVN